VLEELGLEEDVGAYALGRARGTEQRRFENTPSQRPSGFEDVIKAQCLLVGC
jgi:hypothetical protein